VKPEIRETKDGSRTLYLEDLNEHYHSTFGAITESRHVFIQAGLGATVNERLNIFEMGFGTGLNAFLTLTEIIGTGKIVKYTGMELYPLENTILESLNYDKLFPKKIGRYYKLLHKAPWNKPTEIIDEFSIEKILDNISHLNAKNQFDLVYFDAFSPEVQPELWTTEIFIKIFSSMRSGAVLTTYSSKGQVRRNLSEAGFKVEKLPGPPGKIEMTRAWKG